MRFEEPLVELPTMNRGVKRMSGRHGSAVGAFESYLEDVFSVRERGSNVSREVRAGFVTWVTMSYIVVVNPMILSSAAADGTSPIPFRAACHATSLSAAFACVFVGITANLPFGLAAGMGLNSYLRYGVIGRLGFSANAALACCFVQSSVFAVLAASGLADRMQALLPSSLKSAITVAIGVFQAFIGLQLMGLVVKSDTTLVELGDLTQPGVWLVFVATILVAALLVRKTKGALLVGIVFMTVASHLLGLRDSSAGVGAVVSQDTPIEGAPSSGAFPAPTIFGLDFTAAFDHPKDFATVVVCMLFIVVFDTAGVQHGLGQQGGLLNADGLLPKAKFAYLASAFGSGMGAFMGTSPVIIHNESAAGIQEGGRTGLCAVTTGLLFLLSPALVPIIEMIPSTATAPCLILVGTLMMGPVRDIDFGDLRLALPCFLIIVVTPLAYSISAGIFIGIASYCVLSAVLRVAELADEVGGALYGTRSTCSDRATPLPEVC